MKPKNAADFTEDELRRIESKLDENAAAGTHGPNVGQAQGWGRGTA